MTTTFAIDVAMQQRDRVRDVCQDALDMYQRELDHLRTMIYCQSLQIAESGRLDPSTLKALRHLIAREERLRPLAGDCCELMFSLPMI